MPTMFAAYDYHGKTEPRFFPLADTAETTATIATRAYDLGIGIKKDGIMREIVGISGDTALIHFGTLVRFSGRSKLKMLAMYAVGASDDDKNALIRMAEIASIDKSFMTGMWEHFKAARRSRDGEQLSEQDHLHIALVTDLQAPARYAATAKDSGVSL